MSELAPCQSNDAGIPLLAKDARNGAPGSESRVGILRLRRPIRVANRLAALWMTIRSYPALKRCATQNHDFFGLWKMLSIGRNYMVIGMWWRAKGKYIFYER
jgi:hypothetical protein